MEIAKAFEAPLLANCPSNSSAKEVAKTTGEVAIRYGAIGGAYQGVVGQNAEKIAFADASVVHRPRKGVQFDA